VKGEMEGLTALNTEQLHAWTSEAMTHARSGQLPDYIPRLSRASPHWFALQITGVDGQTHTLGDSCLEFPLMSIVKPFLLLYLLCQWGEESVFKRVGIEPSSEPYNSLSQLQHDQGWPRNPMINSGAITLASILSETDSTSGYQSLWNWLNYYGHCQLFLDERMLASVKSFPNPRNEAIARELATRGHLTEAVSALDTYNRLCCLSGTIVDLAHLGMLLLECPPPLQSSHCHTVKALMTTCGLYQASGRFAVQVGLPTKSGVSGAVLSVVPHLGVIACYSPPLNREGNSVAGLFMVEQIAKALDLSIFS